jgi:hypothetical protein
MSNRKEELLYLTFVFSVQHAKQSQTNECSIRLFVHAPMGGNLHGNKEKKLGHIVIVYLKTTCIDIKKGKDRSNDVFDNNLIKIQYSQSEKNKRKTFFIDQISGKKRKSGERNKQTKTLFSLA